MGNPPTDFVTQHIDIFCCPRCGSSLAPGAESFACTTCRANYPVSEGIPRLFWPNEWDASARDVTDTIKSFYEEHPFPNYDDSDSARSLTDKARQGLFAKLLDDQIPFGARILECGCGTGQLTNFLSVANRTVIGTDLCLNSLRMAKDFKDKNGLEGAHFCQMNLFRPCFKPQSFDLVISNGVLHHTSNPFLAFKSISALVRPGGYILIGLYHKYGRLPTDLRRLVFRLTNDRFTFLDRRTTDARLSEAKRTAWFMDQYKNPHESKHTFGEIRGWVDQTGFTFIHSIPNTVPFVGLGESERLFNPSPFGNWFDRFIVNLGMIFPGHKEGGFFVMIAQRSTR